MRRSLPIALISATFVATIHLSIAADRDWTEVGRALGKKGAIQPGGIYKISLPRTDLHVTLDGVQLKPGFALGSWLAFAPMGNQAIAMGDLVLTQDEVNPVMKKMEENGIAITALHNHLLRAEPATMYMHVMGHGDPVGLAHAIHEALALSSTPLASASGSSQVQAMEIDAAAIDKILGAQGKTSGGVLQYSIALKERIEENGMAVPPSMGTAIGINFQPTGGGKAAITGDFVLTAREVNPVARALRENGIEVTALHNHMLDESPRLFFMHFWAQDDAQKLAKGLRAALDRANVARS
jgi:hypothetical protein